MWPQALQMTRDECRGILRRLELESYSQVISVFRAQGGLSDAKAKLLEELRGIFHISSERHRAEARRVANDEQLATIAEAISGPNTWQEWSREGRRPYPMLPRVAPQTALALIANNVAEEAASENAKLPYPAETAEPIREEQQHQMERQRTSDSKERNNHVVGSDPFKVPKIPSGTKKNLKRNMNEQLQNATNSGKKRATIDNSPHKNNQQAHKQQYPHITANSPQSNSAVMTASGHDRKQQQLSNAQQQHCNQQHLQKQRYFHHQQQLTKQKLAKKAAAAAAAGNAPTATSTTKRQATPAKSGRRANQKLLMEQQQQQQKLAMKQLQMVEPQQCLPPAPIHIDLTSQPTSVVGGPVPVPLTQQQLDLQFVTYTTQNQPPQQIFMDEQQTLALANAAAQPAHVHVLAPNTPSVQVPPLSTTSVPSSSSPQIAVSKRDISKNLNKLQQMQQNQFQTSVVSPINAAPIAGSSPIVPSHDLQTSLGSILSSSSSTTAPKSSEKSLISTTPVQKYIVEERQPGGNTPTSLGSIVNLQSSSTVNAIIQVSNPSSQQPQIMTLPQFSAAATKLRAVNTTLIAPGAKMSPTTTSSKKISTITGGAHSSINAGALHELANVASTQSQVLHIVEQQTPTANNSTNSSPSFTAPIHTPPAVIQIQNSTQGAATTADVSVTSALGVTTQSKVLTTKILPLVLTGSTNQTVSTNSSVVIAGSSTLPGSIASTISTSTGPTIIKNLPSTVVLNTSTSNLTPVTVTGTIFSTLGAGATVFRKPPNIIKATSMSCPSNTLKSPTSSPSSSSTGGPHIISNVKLTPVNVTSSTAGSPLNTSTTFKNVLPSTPGGMMRTSVKICQSPNGKVLIQPAGLVDGSKMKALPHKILTNTSSSSMTGSSATVGGGQRIAIQKVQIIPAPLGSPAGSSSMQTGGNAKTSPLASKSNMIFMPSSSSANVRPVTLSKMGNNLLLKSSAVNAQLSGASDSNAAKTNIVVLSPSTPLKDSLNHQKIETNNSLTEDNTPLDILNMPIVMDPGVGGVTSGTESVTVLSSNIIESNNSCSTTSATTPITIVEQANLNQPNASQQTVILGATDWEMELDQAITTAAHNNIHTQQKSSHHKQKRTISTSSSASNSSMSLGSLTSNSGNKQKRLNNDLISIELKTKGPSTSTMNTLNNIIVVDSFDDVIVEEHEDDLVTTSTHADRLVSSTSSNATTDNKHNEDQPKILDMQIYQQHDGIVGGNKSKISIVGNSQQVSLKTVANAQQIIVQTPEAAQHQHAQIIQLSATSATVEHQQQGQQRQHATESEVDAGFDETIAFAAAQHQHAQIIQLSATSATVEHQQQGQQRQHATESEVDAGFDETIVTEIDENTAIEYIEEDGAVTVSNVTTASTTTTSTTVTVVANSSENIESRDNETVGSTVANSGAGCAKDEEYTKVASNKSMYSSGSSINHLETLAEKNSSDKNTLETTAASTNRQQQKQETIANNSGTQVEP